VKLAEVEEPAEREVKGEKEQELAPKTPVKKGEKGEVKLDDVEKVFGLFGSSFFSLVIFSFPFLSRSSRRDKLTMKGVQRQWPTFSVLSVTNSSTSPTSSSSVVSPPNSLPPLPPPRPQPPMTPSSSSPPNSATNTSDSGRARGRAWSLRRRRGE
jgi:hypothetical protein